MTSVVAPLRTRSTRGSAIRNSPTYLVLFVYAVLVAYPLLWLLFSSLKTNNEIFANPWSLPTSMMWSNYSQAWEGGISQYFLNSLLVTGSATVITVLFAAACAFGLCRVPTAVANLVLVIFIAGLVVSPQVALIPLYKLLSATGLQDTYLAMILPYVAYRLPMCVLLFRSVFIGIPKDLTDSATIDGCSSFQVLYRIYLPMARSVMLTATVVTIYYCWNEFLFAIIFVDTDDLRTIPAGLMSFRDALQTNWGVLLAGLVIAALPIVILFVALQRYFVAGITAGSVKG